MTVKSRQTIYFLKSSLVLIVQNVMNVEVNQAEQKL